MATFSIILVIFYNLTVGEILVLRHDSQVSNLCALEITVRQHLSILIGKIHPIHTSLITWVNPHISAQFRHDDGEFLINSYVVRRRDCLSIIPGP